jgi:signal transduction histidine kinase/AmiR/NasT family two-component response regulator
MSACSFLNSSFLTASQATIYSRSQGSRCLPAIHVSKNEPNKESLTSSNARTIVHHVRNWLGPLIAAQKNLEEKKIILASQRIKFARFKEATLMLLAKTTDILTPVVLPGSSHITDCLSYKQESSSQQPLVYKIYEAIQSLKRDLVALKRCHGSFTDLDFIDIQSFIDQMLAAVEGCLNDKNEPEPFSLKEMLAQIEKMSQVYAQKYQLQFTTFQNALPDDVIGYGEMLKQVLVNFINNAIKYTAKGGSITLITQVVQKVAGTFLLEFSINDTGIGIAPEKAKELFKLHAKINAPIKSDAPSSGVGLSFCNDAILKMNAEWIKDPKKEAQNFRGFYNQAKEGSTFWFKVFVKSVTPPPQEQHLLARPAAAPLAPLSILPPIAALYSLPQTKFTQLNYLVADDIKPNRELLRKMLQSKGCTHIDLVSNADECVAKVALKIYHIVLMDVNMPNESDSQRAIASIRAQDKIRKSYTWIIACTADILEETEKVNYVQNRQMDDYCSKPIVMDELIQIIMRIQQKINKMNN